MNETDQAVIVCRAVAGDLVSFQQLLTLPPAQIEALRDSLPSLVVTKHALLEVLTGFASKATKPDIVQQWASFVRRGYYGTIDGGRHRLHIGYDSRAENNIADFVGRLDELGDSIDGEISEAECAEMIATLQSEHQSGTES